MINIEIETTSRRFLTKCFIEDAIVILVAVKKLNPPLL